MATFTVANFTLPITTMTSREFNQRASEAKRAALEGPVFITDRGRPAHVLLSFEEYQRLSGESHTIGDLLAYPPAAAVPLELPARRDRATPTELD